MGELDDELLDELEPDWNILEPPEPIRSCARCRLALGALEGVTYEGEDLCGECLELAARETLGAARAGRGKR